VKKKYIVKFENHKTLFFVVKNGRKVVVPEGTEGAKKEVIEDERKQLILAFGKDKVILRKGKEITKAEFDKLSPVAQKEYINVVESK